MRTPIIFIVHVLLICIAAPLSAQTKVPYQFHYESDSSHTSTKKLTEIHEPGSTFMRLYFEGTELGEESFLLLEAPDGARQRLRKEDLKNWSYSSAYFNGSTVIVSLFSAQGERNKITINAIAIGNATKDGVKKQAASPEKSSGPTTARMGSTGIAEELPYVAAVGRFTNGNTSYGTGWIAPNGAIVTNASCVQSASKNNFDIIEFNVPPSDSYGVVNHPGPEDQYPIKYRDDTQAGCAFEFKKKYNYNLPIEDKLFWSATWGILEALPNSTGLRPGERQQQYFRIAPNLGSFTLETKEVMIDILHYGETNDDLLDGGQNYRTLKRYTTKLQPQSEYLTKTQFDVEKYIVYNLNGGNITFTDSDEGAPITYSGYNIAMGVHSDFNIHAPAVGVGFRRDALFNSLNNYFSTDMVYVDQQSEWDEPTGSIDRPFFIVEDAVDHAGVGGIVNIVKGSYHEPLYISKAVTLKAPVGNVILGQADAVNARKATLPREFFMEANDVVAPTEDVNDEKSLRLSSFPNPFSTGTSIEYRVPQSASVQISIYDKWGNKVRSLVNEVKVTGMQSVAWDGFDEAGRQAMPGLYIIRLETGGSSSAMKIIKN